MSQLLTPVNGGAVPEVQTTTSDSRLNVLSPQYVEVNELKSRPTEWVPEGRPIYRRLPATAETYQIDFFNVVNESNILGNNVTLTGIDKVGYIYVPYGESINGAFSSEVVASDNKKDIFVKAGSIVWEYGKSTQPPTLINLENLDVGNGRYDLAYQLVYDDSPQSQLYNVSDFELTGLPLTITSSTDDVVGWRYGAVNAFLNRSSLFWANEDTFFPSFSQPTEAYLQWESTLSQAYSQLTLRLPSGGSYTGTATLSYVVGSELAEVQTVSLSTDDEGGFLRFNIESPVLQSGWRVTFSSPSVSIASVTVSGVLTLVQPSATSTPRAALALYPTGTLPSEVKNSQGKTIKPAYCMLAIVEVDSNFTLLDIQDARSIIHRDYVPVADWLTKPFDEDLINLFEQVSDYDTLWMAPPSCLKQEYVDLTTDQISVEV